MYRHMSELESPSTSSASSDAELFPLTPTDQQELGTTSVAELPSLNPIDQHPSTCNGRVPGVAMRFNISGPKPQETEENENSGMKRQKKDSGVNRKLIKVENLSQSEGTGRLGKLEIDKILGHSPLKASTCQFQIKWRGWPVETSTLEPLKNLKGCLESVATYFDSFVSDRAVVKPSSRFFQLKESLRKFTSEEFEEASRRYFRENGDRSPEIDLIKLDHDLMILSRLPPFAREPCLVKEVRDTLLRAKIRKKRISQLQMLKTFELEISLLYEGNSPPVTVINEVDLEGPPSELIYVDKYIAGPNVVIPSDPESGCDCTATCYNRRCLKNHYTKKKPYEDGLVNVKKGIPIYECNKKCPCSEDCRNRVVQKGRQVPLCLFKTSDGRGWGVKAVSPIPKGTYVCKYTGEVITQEEVKRRMEITEGDACKYMFNLDHNHNIQYIVDAKYYGNISHFINHSCRPNLAVYSVWVDCLDPNWPYLCFFATKNIKEGEELFFDYNCEMPTHPMTRSSSKAFVTCKCGAPKCKKLLFT